MTLNRIEAKSDSVGFVATVTLAVDPDATPDALAVRLTYHAPGYGSSLCHALRIWFEIVLMGGMLPAE